MPIYSYVGNPSGDTADLLVLSAETVAGSDPGAQNTLENPCLVTSQPFTNVVIHEGHATANLLPLSVSAISFEVN